ncbi:hypothetical protein RclHR1_06290001 [Rhizophagus clarus]|uniref:Uncharacterized protein n=1 Tax=Rhizophagus clarus TaxID=94130 RepID=A0A2Z6RRK8_9GLOM|nr:hypothetical protein RclHR1_06290001 [Rhizophagus clarus]
MTGKKIAYSSSVVLKGVNNKCFKVLSSEANFLQFSEEDYEDEFKFEIINQNGGYVAIKSKILDFLLNDLRIAFVTKNKYLCAKRFTTSGKYINFSKAEDNVIDDTARMTVGKPVVKSIVRNIIYNLDKAAKNDVPSTTPILTLGLRTGGKVEVSVDDETSFTGQWGTSEEKTDSISGTITIKMPLLTDEKL